MAPKNALKISCGIPTIVARSYNIKQLLIHFLTRRRFFYDNKFITSLSCVEIELYPVRCLVSEVKTVACGADFTVWLTSVEGASILYGQCIIFFYWIVLMLN